MGQGVEVKGGCIVNLNPASQELIEEVRCADEESVNE